MSEGRLYICVGPVYRVSVTCLTLSGGDVPVDVPRVHCTGVMVRLKGGGAQDSQKLLASYGLTVVTRWNPGEAVKQVGRHI